MVLSPGQIGAQAAEAGIGQMMSKLGLLSCGRGLDACFMVVLDEARQKY